MRRSVAAFFVAALLALVLSACGSSDTPPADAQAAQPGATPATAAAQPGVAVPPGQQPGANASTTAPEKPEVPRKFDTTPDTPLFFKQALAQKKPIMVVYYNPDEAVSKLVLGEATAAYKHYEKSALLLLIEANKNEESASLAQELGIAFIPYVAAIDRGGNIVFEHTGYIDSKVFELAFYRASTR